MCLLTVRYVGRQSLMEVFAKALCAASLSCGLRFPLDVLLLVLILHWKNRVTIREDQKGLRTPDQTVSRRLERGCPAG